MGDTLEALQGVLGVGDEAVNVILRVEFTFMVAVDEVGAVV